MGNVFMLKVLLALILCDAHQPKIEVTIWLYLPEQGEQPKKQKKLLLNQHQLRSKLKWKSLSKLVGQDTKVR